MHTSINYTAKAQYIYIYIYVYIIDDVLKDMPRSDTSMNYAFYAWWIHFPQYLAHRTSERMQHPEPHNSASQSLLAARLCI
jgi:hypothetical protein